MEHADLLHYLVSVVERMGIPYLITGSTATIFYGESRFTNDIDAVIDLTESHVHEFCRSFPDPEFYVSEVAVHSAIEKRFQFNIIHPDSGLKIDVMIPPATPFNKSRFARRRRVRPGDYEASFASPEDVILKKLQYYQEGGSDKHLRDIASMLKVSGEQIDLAYIEKWAAALDVLDTWATVRTRVERG